MLVSQLPSRSGISPIGTASPNSGASANTNSSYSQGAFTSGINNLASATSYSLQSTDYQGIIIFNGAAPISVTLNEAVGNNFSCTILNLGAGAITFTPTGSPLVNGAASLTLPSRAGAQVFFADRAWWVYSGLTGAYTPPELSFSNIAGNLATAQMPTAGISVTIATAALTVAGTEGSMTFTAGLLTAQTAAT